MNPIRARKRKNYDEEEKHDELKTPQDRHKRHRHHRSDRAHHPRHHSEHVDSYYKDNAKKERHNTKRTKRNLGRRVLDWL